MTETFKKQLPGFLLSSLPLWSSQVLPFRSALPFIRSDFDFPGFRLKRVFFRLRFRLLKRLDSLFFTGSTGITTCPILLTCS